VIIDDLNLFYASLFPTEADSILIVDPNTVLALSSSLQGLQAIPWRDGQIS
jgi:hypothetical protein